MNISNYNNNYNKNELTRGNNSNNNNLNNVSSQSTGKANKSFGSYFSQENNTSANQQPQMNPLSSSNNNTIINNNNSNNISLSSTISPGTIPGISPTSTPKSNILTAFTVKIGEAKLGLLNSTDLHPLVQLQFRRKIWRTQLAKGLYPSWKENKRFEITTSSSNSHENIINNNSSQNATLQLQTHSSNNSSTASSSASSNNSSSNNNNNNQSGQQFLQQQQQQFQSQSDFNLYITLIHVSANEEIELGRSCLNVLEEEKKKKDREQWVCIQTSSNAILGSVQVQLQFEYLMQYLSVNKNSHQTFLSQLKQQQQQLLVQQQQQKQQFQALQTSFPLNKRSPSAYSDDQRNDFQKHPSLSLHEQQLGLKQNKQVLLQQQQQQQLIQQQQHPYYQNGEMESVQYRQQQQMLNKYSFENNNTRISNNNNPNSVGSSFSSSSSSSKQKIAPDTDLTIQTHPQSINGNELALKIAIEQKKTEALAEKERQINERFLQAQAENIQLQRESAKLEQSKGKLHAMKEELLLRDQGNISMQSKLERATRNLDENRKLLQNYAKQYQSLVEEEHAINEWKQTKQAQRAIVQQQITTVALEESLAKRDSQFQIANRAVSRLMIANKYPEISDLMFNRIDKKIKDNQAGSMPLGGNNRNNRNIQHLRVNSWHSGGLQISNNSVNSYNNKPNQTQYTVALNSLNHKIETFQQLLFDKNNEIEQLRQSIHAIENHFF